MASGDLTRFVLTLQSLCTDSSLSAVQYIYRLDGGTQAHLIRASDGNLYAVKFQNNPKSSRVLASELLATRLGLWLGLPMAQAEVIEVSERLVAHALLRIENGHKLTRCATGRQLAIRYMPDALDSVPQRSFERVTNSQDFVCVLAFDKWTGNCDNRQAVFMREEKRYSVTFIDQHNCFNADRWSFPDLLHHGAYDHKHVYRNVTGWQWFEPTLSRIETITKFDVWKLATEIPPEWYQHDTAALSRLIERLYKRRFGVRQMIRNLCNAECIPFPRWKHM